MRLLGEETEEKLCALETARGWQRSGLITKDQLSGVEETLGPLPSQAGWAVRLLLFGFALSARGAFNSFVTWTFYGRSIWMDNSKTSMWPYFFASVPVFYLFGEWVARRYRLHRFGIEEGILVGALVQLWIALTLLLVANSWHWKDLALSVFLPMALAWAALYLRTGYAYALFGAVAGLTAAVLGRLTDLSDHQMRAAAAGLFACMLSGSFLRREPGDHDRLGWQVLQSALMMMICLVLNVRLESLADLDHVLAPPGGWFYWSSFAAVLSIPVVCLAWAIRRRNRSLLAAGAITVLVAIVSIKPYLGLARHSWDPAVLGAAMMGLSLYLKQRLDSGPQGQRGGWTAKPLIVGRSDGSDMISLVAAAAAASAGGSAPAPQDKSFTGQGGSSGGAGAGGNF